MALEAIGNQAKADRATTRAYGREVLQRLEHGANHYGDDAWWDTAAREGFDRLLREVADEASDQSGWILGCLQVLSTEETGDRIDRDGSHNTRYLLVQAAAFAMQSWVCVQMARNTYREAAGIDDLHAPRHSRPHGFSDPD